MLCRHLDHDPIHPYHRCRSHGSRIYRALLRHGRHSRPGLRPHRYLLSLLRNPHRLDRHRVHRLRHILQRTFRELTETYSPTTQSLALSHECLQLCRWRHGQDGRAAKHRRRNHSHRNLRQRRKYSAPSFVAQHRPGMSGWSLCLASCLLAPTHTVRAPLDTKAQAESADHGDYFR